MVKPLFFELFLSMDLFGPKNMILSIAQGLSKQLVPLYKLLLEVGNTRKYKNCAKINFSTGKIAFLSKSCISNSLFGITEKIL